MCSVYTYDKILIFWPEYPADLEPEIESKIHKRMMDAIKVGLGPDRDVTTDMFDPDSKNVRIEFIRPVEPDRYKYDKEARIFFRHYIKNIDKIYECSSIVVLDDDSFRNRYYLEYDVARKFNVPIHYLPASLYAKELLDAIKKEHETMRDCCEGVKPC